MSCMRGTCLMPNQPKTQKKNRNQSIIKSSASTRTPYATPLISPHLAASPLPIIHTSSLPPDVISHHYYHHHHGNHQPYHQHHQNPAFSSPSLLSTPTSITMTTYNAPFYTLLPHLHPQLFFSQAHHY
jgi:hypothetical protein